MYETVLFQYTAGPHHRHSARMPRRGTARLIEPAETPEEQFIREQNEAETARLEEYEAQTQTPWTAERTRAGHRTWSEIAAHGEAFVRAATGLTIELVTRMDEALAEVVVRASGLAAHVFCDLELTAGRRHDFAIFKDSPSC
jgi:hypothetical protein